ncbi:MAG: phosphomannomutase/phosphoglucomutase [Thiogranum sp.]|nr:phosphomannomutase/phosphoglucomutase [Thiogranum sp.]
MLMLLVAGGVSVLIPPALLYMQAVDEFQNLAQKHAELTATLFANDYARWVGDQVQTAELAVKDPQLARVMESGSDAEKAAQAEALAYLFPASIRVRLLPTGIEIVDLDASPPLSYAALDMLRHAETQDVQPPVEVHMFSTPQQHINLVRRILDPSGRHIVGHLMVSYPVQQLQTLLDRNSMDGYAEIQQVAAGSVVTLGSRGRAALKDAGADSQLTIPGSRWQVSYRAAPGASSGTEGLFVRTAAASGIALVLLSGLIGFTYLSLRRGLRGDQAAVLAVVKDLRDAKVKTEYQASTAEWHDTIKQMIRIVRTGKAPPPPAPAGTAAVGKASQKKDEDVVDELGGDLFFSSSAPDPSRIQVQDSAGDIFRTYDIRGLVGESLTLEYAYEIGRAIGSEAYYRGEQTVVVGRDGRSSSPELSEALIKGLRATGRDVKDIGVAPTPVLYFAAQQLATNSGVMVTGSHNPPEYNGFKIVLAGETLAGEAVQALQRRIESGDLLTGEGVVEQVDIIQEYIGRVCADVQLTRRMKIVIDCGNGVAGAVAPKLFNLLGCDVIELFCDVDGSFPNHHPDPSNPENLSALIKAVQEQGADLGIAFDGDGDRLGVVSAQGDIIWPDRLLMLLAMDVLSRNPGAQVIYDVKSSRQVAKIVAEYGGEPLMWATGHSLIKAKMKETGALLAGEMSGHIFFKERWFGFDDALYSGARLLEVLASDQRSSNEVFASLPDSLNTPELHVPMAEGEPVVFMGQLLENARFDNARIVTIDGMRVEFENGWGLVRASNTMPCLVLRFEADDELSMHRIQEEFRRVILQTDPNLLLPF